MAGATSYYRTPQRLSPLGTASARGPEYSALNAADQSQQGYGAGVQGITSAYAANQPLMEFFAALASRAAGGQGNATADAERARAAEVTAGGRATALRDAGAQAASRGMDDSNGMRDVRSDIINRSTQALNNANLDIAMRGEQSDLQRLGIAAGALPSFAGVQSGLVSNLAQLHQNQSHAILDPQDRPDSGGAGSVDGGMQAAAGGYGAGQPTYQNAAGNTQRAPADGGSGRTAAGVNIGRSFTGPDAAANRVRFQQLQRPWGTLTPAERGEYMYLRDLMGG